MPATTQRVVCLLGLSVSAFQGPPSLPAFGLLPSQRPQRPRNPVELGAATVVATPAPVASRRRVVAPPPRITNRRLARGADESTQVAAARHRYRDVAAPTPDLVRRELARWRHQAINALCYARIALTTGLVWLVHAVAAPLHKRLGCGHFAAASLDHCIQLQRLFLGLARKQKAARTCLRTRLVRAAEVAPNGKCYADGGECFLL